MRTRVGRNLKLDFLRGLAILIVVLGHSIQVNVNSEYNEIWFFIRTFQMPLLFAISGFTSAYSFPSDDVWKYFKGKTKRILIPYIVWATIHYFLMCLLNVFEFKWKRIFSNIIYSYFWFLRHLMVFFFMFTIANFFVNAISKSKERKYGSSVFVVFVMTSVLLLIRKTPLVNQSNVVWDYLWFMIGYFIAIIPKMEKKSVQSISGALKDLLNNCEEKRLLVILLLFMASITIMLFMKNFSQYIVCPFAILLILIISNILFEVCSIKTRQFLCYVGSKSLPIYAIHWCLLFSPGYYNKYYYFMASKIGLVPSVVFTFVIWTAISLVFIHTFQKTRMTKLLLLGE